MTVGRTLLVVAWYLHSAMLTACETPSGGSRADEPTISSAARGVVGEATAAQAVPSAAIERSDTIEAVAKLGKFRVVGVERDDVLNVRLEPDPNARQVFSIPSGAAGIEVTGQSKTVRGARWVEVRHVQGLGWVNGRFLEPEPVGEPPNPSLSITIPSTQQFAPNSNNERGNERSDIVEARSEGSGTSILGVRLGMSMAAVERVLGGESPPFSATVTVGQYYDPKFRKYELKSETSNEPLGQKYYTYNRSWNRDHDSVVVFFSPPPAAPTAELIARRDSYNRRPTLVETYRQAIVAKYGAPRVHPSLGGRKRDALVWSKAGNIEPCLGSLVQGNVMSTQTYWVAKGEPQDCGETLIAVVDFDSNLVSNVTTILGDPKVIVENQRRYQQKVERDTLAANANQAAQAGVTPDL